MEAARSAALQQNRQLEAGPEPNTLGCNGVFLPLNKLLVFKARNQLGVVRWGRGRGCYQAVRIPLSPQEDTQTQVDVGSEQHLGPRPAPRRFRVR